MKKYSFGSHRDQGLRRVFARTLAASFFFLTSLAVLTIGGCADSDSMPLASQNSVFSHQSLFVASGSCYAGGVATAQGSATVVAFDAGTAAFERVIVDYNSISPGDMPIAIADYDSGHILVLVENTAGRRIDLVSKQNAQVTTFLTNAAAFSVVGNIFRGMAKNADGSLLVSKTTAIERFSSSKARILQGANPWVNAPAGACATSTTLISALTVASNGKIIFAHAGATPNNKIAMISATGYAAAGDCLTSQTAPTTLALPDTVLIHSSGKLITAYGSTTLASNLITASDLNVTTNVIGTATTAFSDPTIINGPSAMAENTTNGQVFIANGNGTFNTIEKFNFDSNAKVLTVATPTTFIGMNIYSKCIADMKVISE